MGMTTHFEAETLRATGRNSPGVWSMKLRRRSRIPSSTRMSSRMRGTARRPRRMDLITSSRSVQMVRDYDREDKRHSTSSFYCVRVASGEWRVATSLFEIGMHAERVRDACVRSSDIV
mmetsp:Transcript_32057/g.96048  ORF Transcript_32057/g.96048 Transcript_32057/m.96048 type:complete len:118 (-) Transcript_32057:361-714(-)